MRNNAMTSRKELVKEIRRFEEIMEEIIDLVDEAESIVLTTVGRPGSIYGRAIAYWIPTIKGTVSGKASMQSMEDTLEEIKEELGFPY